MTALLFRPWPQGQPIHLHQPIKVEPDGTRIHYFPRRSLGSAEFLLQGQYLDHRLLRERQILEALGAGTRTIPELVKAIYAEVPTALHGHAAMSVHSHLKKLKQEARVSEKSLAGAPSRWTLV